LLFLGGVRSGVGYFGGGGGGLRLRVSENRVLRRIFGHTKNEVTGEWRKLHNEELHDLYYAPFIIRVIESRRTR